ncbi:MAG TPA: argininosuccinate lyase [Vicinamibacterales bacterium]
MKFAPEYVTNVLNDNFEDAKELLLAPLMAINYAHLVMLAERGIIAAEEARALRDALDGISLDRVRQVLYDGTYEDLFFYIERLIDQACGADIAGRLHTARSRNDLAMTMYRMRQREFIAALAAAALDLREALIALAERHKESVYGAHTHTQPAQPTTIAHYLLAIIEQLERDSVRLGAAYDATNRNPLGACAITGTGFAIDRDRTSQLLGFDGPTCNTYGSIATVDYLLESVSATSVLIVGLGRVVQDFLLWCTMEFGYLRLSDGFVQGSSIMPQKRNPVALEHARAIGSKAVGQAQAIITTVHNTPFGDIVDTEDDLQPLVASMFRDATRMVTLVAATMRLADFNVERLASRAGEGGTTLTELADTLVRDHGLSFRNAHAIAALLLKARTEDPSAAMSGALAKASNAILGRPLEYSESDLHRIMSPRHFVEVRTTFGGPAPSETSRAITESARLLQRDRTDWQTRRAQLQRAEATLAAKAKSL